MAGELHGRFTLCVNRPLECHWGPFKGLNNTAVGVSRMSRSSVRPCYNTESWCWAQDVVLLHRIFSVTGTSSRISAAPPHAPRILTKLLHLRHFVIDIAYVAPLAQDEKSKHLKRPINALHMLAMNGSSPTEMRIVRKFPRTAWNQVWKKLHASPFSDEIKSIWYKTLCASCSYMVQPLSRSVDCSSTINRMTSVRLWSYSRGFLYMWPREMRKSTDPTKYTW
jgi:hypothetical protein